ncbi:hypothetical protein CLV31_1101 [Algoriphagus aquaeductus]|uniref:Capsular polysaccharide biosynthesis protein n=1 Tax=Algoriphagus aquaeductus TaxID=475299 RepID=A0A326RPP3_9BACT|nr:hypothetical protein [Algoriphagus aquaeductus]PZV81470.1 hypothetical protein CLV31_1101 [Algoriphagus aquaeductus]
MQKIEIGKGFYEKKVRGLAVGDKSFTRGQTPDLDNLKLDVSKKKIVIFNSSPDEIYSLGDEWGWNFEGLTSQADVISFLCSELLGTDNEFQIILRSHPNLKNYKGKEKEIYKSLEAKFTNFIYISPNSSESSYALMEIADYVISFGSTIGIESSFHKKNSILIGKSFYYNLNVVNTVNSLSELKHFLYSKEVNDSQVNYLNILKYGFYNSNKIYNVFNYFKIQPAHMQLDGFNHYGIVRNVSSLLKLKFIILSIFFKLRNRISFLVSSKYF